MNIAFHCYVDNYQVYFPLKHTGASSVQLLLNAQLTSGDGWHSVFWILMRKRQRLCCSDPVVSAVFLQRLVFITAMQFLSELARPPSLLQHAPAPLLSGCKQARAHQSNFSFPPVHLQIHFKILSFVFKSPNGHVPFYLSELQYGTVRYGKWCPFGCRISYV